MTGKVTIAGSRTTETIVLPLPEQLATLLGWKEGDEVVIDIPTYRGGAADSLLIHKK